MFNKKKNQLKFRKKIKFKKRFKKFILSNFFFLIEQYPLYLDKSLATIKYLLRLRIKRNNIFAILSILSGDIFQVSKLWSCGLHKLNSSKRRLKFVVNTLLGIIFRGLRKIRKLIICIKCPRYLYKFIFRKIKSFGIKASLIVFDSSKIFNGCRAKKKRRKKHQKFRALKS